jgi:hypothetical protein
MPGLVAGKHFWMTLDQLLEDVLGVVWLLGHGYVGVALS